MTLALLLLGAGCVTAPKKPVHTIQKPSSVIGQEGATFGDASGQLAISFECEGDLIEFFSGDTPGATRKVTRKVKGCADVGQVKPLEVTLISPWGSTATANLKSGVATFELDWSGSGIDPLAPDGGLQLEAGWKVVSGSNEIAVTLPKAVALEALALIAVAEGIDLTTEQEDRSVELEIQKFEVTPTQANAGSRLAVSVTLHNKGPGVAFRTRVVLRSSVAGLHGMGVAFGKLHTGETVTREVTILVPSVDSETDALLIAAIEEANHTHRDTEQQRISIAPAPKADVVAETSDVASELVLKCHFEGQAGEERPELEVEGTIKTRCVIRNVGVSPSFATLTVAIEQEDETLAQPSAKKLEIGPGKVKVERFEFRLPSKTGIGDLLTIVAQLNGSTKYRIVGMIRRVGVCPSGPLSRADYNKKRAELVKARDVGALSSDEFDQYDAELVLCIE